jgi:hypothetical protein
LEIELDEFPRDIYILEIKQDKIQSRIKLQKK